MALLMWLACAPEIPRDPAAEAPTNVISGSVVFSGAVAGGPVAVLLFAADDLPPPAGLGSPLDFSMVPKESFTGADAGMQAADFAVTGVADGQYALSALMDVDGDFQPLTSVTAGATCGDWIGAHLDDLETQALGTVAVEGGEEVDDVTVILGSKMETERPAFTLVDTSVDQTAVQSTFRIAATAVHSELVQLDGPFDGTSLCETALWFYAPDADGDGAPDPHPNEQLAAAGLFDVWPKVYLQTTDDTGTWASEAVVYPSPLLDGSATLGTPSPLTELTVVFVPAAIHTRTDGTEETVYAPDLPQATWSVTVVSFTGQTWTLPNELPGVGVTATDWDPTLQGVGLSVL